MKTIAALFLALLLAVMAYGIFWLVCLTYTTNQMRGAVREALHAEMSYGTPQWVPDPNHVTMDLPNTSLTLKDGPIREIHASSLRVVSDFLMRDRWSINLPKHVEVVLANGKTVLLETDHGQVIWLSASNSLSLRAASVRLLELNGTQIARIGDVMLERKASENGIRLNLASRPQMADGEAVLSGQLVLPPEAFSRVVNLFGGSMPSIGDIMRAIVEGVRQHGGTLQMDNITFKVPSGVNGAVYGSLQILQDGRMLGNAVLTSDNPARMYGWVQQAGLLMPRSHAETIGVARFTSSMRAARVTASMENMQATLMLNGFPVGALPNALQMVNRLWP